MIDSLLRGWPDVAMNARRIDAAGVGAYRYASAMYTSTFTFAKREFDDAFHALDQVIAATAKSLPGYLGEESWENATTGLTSNVYYWESMDALRALIEHPAHQAAKREQARWLAGYQVVIAQVLGHYGDGKIDHPLARAAARTPQAQA
jgi:heme-degrading monooxygenase HmoA